MPVPLLQTTALDSLQVTLAACATVQRLMGVGNADAAMDSIYQRFVRDDFAPDTDMADPNRQPLDPFPRIVLFDMPQHVEFGADSIVNGMGQFTAFLQFLPFTAEALSAWYGQAIFDPTDRDHWKHARNLMVSIRNEIQALGWQGPYLEVRKLAEDCYLAPPFCEGGQNIWTVSYDVHWAGLP